MSRDCFSEAIFAGLFSTHSCFLLYGHLPGAASDMESSTKLARAMVTMYGMSDKVMFHVQTSDKNHLPESLMSHQMRHFA